MDVKEMQVACNQNINKTKNKCLNIEHSNAYTSEASMECGALLATNRNFAK